MATQTLFDIGNIIVDPASTFVRLKVRPSPWLPLLVLIVLSLAISYWWISTVDFAWLREHMLAMQPNAKPEVRAALEKFVTPKSMLWTTGLSVVLGTLVLAALAAVYYLLAGKVLGATIAYGKWFGFAAWVSVPRLLLIPLSALQIMTSGGRVGPEDLNMASINYLLLHLPPSNPWATFAGNIDLVTLWSIALATIGLKAWTGRSSGECVTAALLPYLVIYGLWAAKIALLG
jgi:hypothetical protein